MQVVVAGMGDVGGRAAALLAADGHDVVGVRRSDVPGPDGVRMVAGDLRDPSLVDRLPPAVDVLLVTAAADGRDPDAYRRAYLAGPTTLLDALLARGDRPRVVFTSSSAVYGQADGEHVDETSPTEPSSPTAQVLVEAEQALLDRDTEVAILRLTGIYGPGRDRLLRLVEAGDAVVGTEPAWTNRIHAHDAATAVVLLATMTEQPPAVVVGTDDHAAPRDEVYGWLAEQLDAPPPVVDDERASSRGTKRCHNDLLRSLGWEPRYPTYRDGYAEMIAERRA